MTTKTAPAVNPQAALYAALAAAQAELGNVAKDARGNYGGYATLAAVLATVLPVLSAHGLGVLQLLSDADGGRIAVTTSLTHAAGGVVSSTVSGRPSKDTPQGQGSTITYLRRYALMALVGVAPTDDDGQAAEPQRRDTVGRDMVATPPAPRCTPLGLVAAIATAGGVRTEVAASWLDATAEGWRARDGAWMAHQRSRFLSNRPKLTEALTTHAATMGGDQ